MIKPLTSLRIVFAFMVFLSHLKFLKNSDSILWRNLYEYVFYEGYIGVSFFFILSGFIIAYNYQDALSKKERSKKAFYIARFARIYPLHILTLIFALPHTYDIFFELKSGLLILLSNITLIQSFIPIEKYFFSLNAPSWSISNEMFFYAMFPIIILILLKLTNKQKIIATTALIALIPLLTLVIPEEYRHALFDINPLFRIVDFIIGIALFNIYKNLKEQKNKISINHTILEVTALGILLLFFSLHRFVPDVARYSYYYWLPISYMILVFAFQKGSISNLLSNKVMIHLGKISFGVYLFHFHMLRYVAILKQKINHLYQINEYETIILSLVLTLIISHLSYIYFEEPVNKYIKRKMIK